MDGYYMDRDPSFLFHYGVLGMKWGVRKDGMPQGYQGSGKGRGQKVRIGPVGKVDGDLKSLPKGSRLNSVSINPDSSSYKKSGKWVYTYRPENSFDSKIYRGPFSYFKVESTNKYVYEHAYETVKDLKMPTAQERIDEFINLYTDNKKMTIKDLQNEQNAMIKYNVGPEKVRNLDLKNLSTAEDYRMAYEIFNHAMEKSNEFKSTKKYSEIMSTKYDAMIDDNNQGVYNNAKEPIIIFKPDEVLKEVGNARLISLDEVYDNTMQVSEEMQRQGRRMVI